jgi:hypothetical protein
MATRQKHGWIFWVVIAALPAMPVATHYVGAYLQAHYHPTPESHGPSPIGLLWFLVLCTYFIGLAVYLRSVLIGGVLGGIVLDMMFDPNIGGPRPFIWFGGIVGVIWDLCLAWKRRSVSRKGQVNPPAPNPDPTSESN